MRSLLTLLLPCLLLAVTMPAAATDQLRCAVCGQPISGAYVTALGRTWHPEHFTCAGCGRAIGDQRFFEHDGRPYCQGCYTERFCARCSVCGKPLTSACVEDAWGNRYHPEHARELPTCSSCGRLVCSALTGGGLRYGDGRPMCLACRATAVDEVGQAERLLEQVRADLTAAGLAFVQPHLPVRLVSQPDLARRAGSDRTDGRTQTVVEMRGKRVVDRRIGEIDVLYGLPRVHFGGVAAHELGHVYLFEQSCTGLPPQVEEGFCELLSLLWLQARPEPEAAVLARAKERSDDRVYGAGLRAALASLQGRSLQALAASLRTARAFPPALSPPATAPTGP